MSDTHSGRPVEGPWPDSYEAPTLEPLGSVWERTGGLGLSGSDASSQILTL
jgi:hypothetical protein